MVICVIMTSRVYFNSNFTIDAIDPEHPIAPANIPFIQGNQFEEVTVPCKPTSKKWEVQLIKDEDEVNQLTR